MLSQSPLCKLTIRKTIEYNYTLMFISIDGLHLLVSKSNSGFKVFVFRSKYFRHYTEDKKDIWGYCKALFGASDITARSFIHLWRLFLIPM